MITKIQNEFKQLNDYFIEKANKYSKINLLFQKYSSAVFSLNKKYNIDNSLNGHDSDQEEYYSISNYLIKYTLGKGTYGKVKLAIYIPTNEKVAIKILNKNKISNLENEIRLQREFDMSVKFNHPNVISVSEIFENKDAYFSVMEYCEGGELFTYITKNKYLVEEEAAFFYYQLICGLEYIHSLGIVHRDLKPENLLLTKDNILKIIDFGLSNYFKKGDKNLLSTPCGSPRYASPEMISGEKYDGFKTDIWSTGIILFAMLCGYLPFEDKNIDVLFKKITECKIFYPKFLSKVALDLLKKILIKNVDKRINIDEIKKHQFYILGKEIFEQEFSVVECSKIYSGNKSKEFFNKYLNDKEKTTSYKKWLVDNEIVNIESLYENINLKNDNKNKKIIDSLEKLDLSKIESKEYKDENKINNTNQENEYKCIKTETTEMFADRNLSNEKEKSSISYPTKTINDKKSENNLKKNKKQNIDYNLKNKKMYQKIKNLPNIQKKSANKKKLFQLEPIDTRNYLPYQPLQTEISKKNIQNDQKSNRGNQNIDQEKLKTLNLQKNFLDFNKIQKLCLNNKIHLSKNNKIKKYSLLKFEAKETPKKNNIYFLTDQSATKFKNKNGSSSSKAKNILNINHYLKLIINKKNTSKYNTNLKEDNILLKTKIINSIKTKIHKKYNSFFKQSKLHNNEIKKAEKLNILKIDLKHKIKSISGEPDKIKLKSKSKSKSKSKRKQNTNIKKCEKLKKTILYTTNSKNNNFTLKKFLQNENYISKNNITNNIIKPNNSINRNKNSNANNKLIIKENEKTPKYKNLTNECSRTSKEGKKYLKQNIITNNNSTENTFSIINSGASKINYNCNVNKKNDDSNQKYLYNSINISCNNIGKFKHLNKRYTKLNPLKSKRENRKIIFNKMNITNREYNECYPTSREFFPMLYFISKYNTSRKTKNDQLNKKGKKNSNNSKHAKFSSMKLDDSYKKVKKPAKTRNLNSNQNRKIYTNSIIILNNIIKNQFISGNNSINSTINKKIPISIHLTNKIPSSANKKTDSSVNKSIKECRTLNKYCFTLSQKNRINNLFFKKIFRLLKDNK